MLISILQEVIGAFYQAIMHSSWLQNFFNTIQTSNPFENRSVMRYSYEYSQEHFQPKIGGKIRICLGRKNNILGLSVNAKANVSTTCEIRRTTFGLYELPALVSSTVYNQAILWRMAGTAEKRYGIFVWSNKAWVPTRSNYSTWKFLGVLIGTWSDSFR